MGVDAEGLSMMFPYISQNAGNRKTEEARRRTERKTNGKEREQQDASEKDRAWREQILSRPSF